METGPLTSAYPVKDMRGINHKPLSAIQKIQNWIVQPAQELESLGPKSEYEILED